MFKITRILGILCMVALASCARNLDPIEKSEIISKSKEDIKKIDAIKNSNLNWEDEIEIDLYTAIALAIKNNKELNKTDLKVLKSISKKFPFFTPSKVLSLLLAKKYKTIDYSKILESTATNINDRIHLYYIFLKF